MNTKFLGSVIGAIEDGLEEYRGKEDIDGRIVFEKITDITNKFLTYYDDMGIASKDDIKISVEAAQYIIDQIIETGNIWHGIENTKEKYKLKLSDLYEVVHMDTKTGETKIIKFNDEK